MNKPKNLVLIVCGAVTALAVLALGTLAVQSAVRKSRIAEALAQKKSRGDALHNRRPFPSEENVRRLEAQLSEVNNGFTNLYARLSRGQTTPSPMEPAQFPLRMQQEFRALTDAAISNNVILPARFSFGFDRYAKNLPGKQDLPRLQRQLFNIGEVCKILFSAQVRDVVSIDRHVFEDEAGRAPDAAAPAAGMPGLPPMAMVPAIAAAPAAGSAAVGFARDPSGLFEKERCIFVFNAKESAVWDVLNAIPRLKPFCVVASVELANEVPAPRRMDISGPGAEKEAGGVPEAGALPVPAGAGPMNFPGGGAGGVPAALPPGGDVVLNTKSMSAEQRVVAGRSETIRVVLTVDFYHFLKADDQKASKENQP